MEGVQIAREAEVQLIHAVPQILEIVEPEGFYLRETSKMERTCALSPSMAARR